MSRQNFVLLVLCSGLIAATAQSGNTQSTQKLMTEGRSHLAKGDLAAAQKSFRSVTKSQPANLAAWHFLGYALHAGGRPEQALPAFMKAVAHPRLAAADSYNIACIHCLAGRLSQSLSWLEKAWRAGYRDLAHARKDADLARAREQPAFQQLLQRLEAELIPFGDEVTVLHEIPGDQAGDQFGWVADNAGDVDGDGRNDIIIGAPTVRRQGRVHGAVYIHSGRTGKRLFQILGKPGDYLGNGVDGIGDVDGDGHADFTAGGPATQQSGSGRICVYSGKTGKLLASHAGDANGDRMGVEAAGIGDLNNDGINDYLAGAERHDGNGKDSGRIVIYSGRTHKAIARLDGERAGDQFGRAAEGSFANGDGLLVVGAAKAGPQRRGRVYVYRGQDLKLAFTIEADSTGAALGEMFVSIPGDLNGDSIPDVYASDWRNSAKGPNTGRVYLYSGKDGSQISVLTGAKGEGFGIGKAVAGDVDADGTPDLIIGAWQNSDTAKSAGKSYLVSGRSLRRIREYGCQAAGDTFGFDAPVWVTSTLTDIPIC